MPQSPEAHNDMGHVLAALGHHDEAIKCYERTIALRPGYAPAHNNWGLSLAAQGRLPEAVAQYREALRHEPDGFMALNNLGLALVALDQPEEAIRCYQEVLRIRPEYVEARINWGACLAEQNKLDEAAAVYEKAIEQRPQLAEAHSNLSYIRLAQGRFEEGWREYEWRRRRREAGQRILVQPEWDGAPLEGRTILLYAEQGLGDTLQFVRYAPLVNDRGGRVVVECQKALWRLLGRCQGIDELVPQGASLPPFDVHCPLPSLPGIFRTSLETVPAPVPYVFADRDLVEQWRKEVSQWDGMKVGIVWKGNPKYTHDRQRSIPLKCFSALALVAGVKLFSLQKGSGALVSEGESSELQGSFPVVDWTARLDEAAGPFMDTAAIIRSLDLVIAPDTSIAHLAGALGTPVWLALATVPDWRWLIDREDSPWYPNTRLFRQRRRGDWAEVFERMVEELRKCAQDGALRASAQRA